MTRKILQFINTLRDSHPDMVDIFTKGSCINMYFLLRIFFPEAKAYYNSDHIITKIDDKFYDITGLVDGRGYLELFEIYSKARVIKAVRQMTRACF